MVFSKPAQYYARDSKRGSIIAVRRSYPAGIFRAYPFPIVLPLFQLNSVGELPPP
jgi:hypothetical protein